LYSVRLTLFIHTVYCGMNLTIVSKINIGAPNDLQTQLRKESARLWCDMVKLHKYIRKRRWAWPTPSSYEKHFKNKYALHSQTIQALIKKFFANIDTTTENRKNGDRKARYPFRDKKRFQVVMYKQSAIKVHGNHIILSNGKGKPKLKIKAPKVIQQGKIVGAELGFHELRLTIRQELDAVENAGENIVAADLGVIHLAAMTDGNKSEVIVGRALRSLVQYRNKKLAHYARLISQCKKGSRRLRKLRKAKARMLARNDCQQRNLLHHASKQMINFCVEQDAGTLVVGDCINLSKNSRKKKKGSRRSNQMNSGNPLSQLLKYAEYKGKVRGVKLVKQEESYTSQTCPKCGHRHKPSGRIYQCKNPECDFIGIRDIVGAANIKNKYENTIIKPNHILAPERAKYRRPVKAPVTRLNCVVPLTTGKWLNTTPKTVQRLSSVDGQASLELPSVA